MITRIPDLPENIVGLEASEQITSQDYETVVLPEIKKMADTNQKIRVLYQFDPSFSGFTFGAMWEDLKLGLSYFRKWEKIAVISDVLWLAIFTRMMGILMPCKVKVFDNKSVSAAKRWIKA